MKNSDKREDILHSEGVARKMRELALKKFPDYPGFSEQMYMLGLLHNIGYEFSEIPEKHGEAGGEILEKSDYRYWREVYHHGKAHAAYDSIALRILNTADLMIDRSGKDVGVTERLHEIGGLYGEDSSPYEEYRGLAEKLGLLG